MEVTENCFQKTRTLFLTWKCIGILLQQRLDAVHLPGIPPSDLADGGATRIGYGQSQAILQGPLGYDKLGYSWRSRYGTAFHTAKGKTFSHGGNRAGDVIGLLIILPGETNTNNLSVPDSFKDKPLVRFKSHLYYEEKDSVSEKKEDAQLPVHQGSKIIGFKNGVCQAAAFENIAAGTYYPTISLYRSTVVRSNFGPEPWIKPETDIDFRMISEKAEEAIIEQTVSDLLFLTSTAPVNLY